MFETLEKKFDLLPAEVSYDIIDAEPVDEVEENEDAELVKETLRDLVTKSIEMLEDISAIAKATEHPRAFEVAATLVKTITDVAGKLGDIAAKEQQTKQPVAPQQVTNQNLYVGTTEELMNMIKSLDNKK